MNDRILELARALVEEGCLRGRTVSFAESCTGGLVSGAVTAIAGSSKVLLGSAVTYALSAKEGLLGVSEAILDGPGAVSSECAAAMAEGSRRVFASDVAVSVTGIAGPGGAEPGKPVGTVWFGVCAVGTLRTCRELFGGSRDEVREQAVARALEIALEELRVDRRS